jgi:hypothetical protein
MIVAMIAVWMVKSAVNEIVHMVAVRNRLVAAAGAMVMFPCVAQLAFELPTSVRVGLGDGDHMLFDAVTLLVAQVAIMNVIDVSVVFDCCVTASRTVRVGVFRLLGHFILPIERVLSKETTSRQL